MKFSRIFILLFSLIFASASAAGQVNVTASADTSRPIYLGSPFNYIIEVKGAENYEGVDIAPLIEFQPSGPSRQQSTSIINNRVSSSLNLIYSLVPKRLGQITIPGVDVKIDGKVYRTNPVIITVVKPGETKQIDVEMKLSSQTCYTGQPVILTVSCYIWTDIVRSKAIANVNIQVPALENSAFYVEEPDALSGARTDLPVNSRNEAFYQDQIDHNGVNCLRLQLVKVLIPKSPGRIEIAPSVFSADLAVAQSRRSRNSLFDDFFGPNYEYQRFGTSSQQLALDVKPLPDENKPADFYGLVGSYTIRAQAAPTQVSVGDPITLTINIGGSQYLAPVRWPDLEAAPGMLESFKIPAEKAAGEIKDGYKVFTQTLRAKSDKVTQIPPIPLSFFDAEQGRYVTIHTYPIPLEVAPTRIVTTADILSGPSGTQGKQLQAVQGGISANFTGAEAIINQHFSIMAAASNPLILSLWTGPFAILAASALLKLASTTGPQRKLRQRKKTACSRAILQIRTAAKTARPEEAVSKAMKQYVADKWDRVCGSLTAEECAMLIQNATGNEQISSQFRRIMESLEAAAYSPTAFKLTRDKEKEITGLLRSIEKNIK